MVGVPYPPPHDIKIKEKKKFLNKLCNKGIENTLKPDTWYFVETVRAINQAAGRVIRHK